MVSDAHALKNKSHQLTTSESGKQGFRQPTHFQTIRIACSGAQQRKRTKLI